MLNKTLILFYRAKSTELLLSPPVSYDSDSDLDAENEFYDLEVDVKDDDFYYVSWKDPIYDYQGWCSVASIFAYIPLRKTCLKFWKIQFSYQF
jgi:hypothetical protein